MSDINTRTFIVDEKGDFHSEESVSEQKCKTCDKKQTACISFLAHENAMMHKDMDNERAHRSNLFVCITVIILTIIFVTAYTLRMNSFIDTIKSMNAAIVELAHAKGIIAP